MMKNLLRLVAFGLACFSGLVFAGESLSTDAVKDLMKERFPSLSISLINDSPMPGFYAARADGNLIYISKDARFFIQGTAIDMEQKRNLNREQLAVWDNMISPMRKAEIAKLSEKDMVIFKSPTEKHVITVFTDIDCGYCRKLHRERQTYLDLGITIRYLGFPRAGLASASGKKLEGIWCSSDRQTAMTNAKIKQKYSNVECKSPIDEHMKLVRKFGLTGTPAIILENGNLVSGAMPADMLIQSLEGESQQQAAN